MSEGEKSEESGIGLAGRGIMVGPVCCNTDSEFCVKRIAKPLEG